MESSQIEPCNTGMHPVNVYATTTSMRFEEELREMGVKEVILIESIHNKSLTENKYIQKIVSDIGGFDCVFDPFFDLHLGQVVNLMAAGDRYITCGLYDQYFDLIGKGIPSLYLDGLRLMSSVMLKNIQIIGNCIGQAEDLKNAIQDYVSGNLNVAIDSVFSGKQVGAFFHRFR